MNVSKAFGRALLLAGTAIVLTETAALGQPCEVIGAGFTQYSSIGAALAALPDRDDNILHVSGVCKEKVQISNHRNLAIVGGDGARLEQPDGTTEAHPLTLAIHTSDDIRVRNLTIRGTPNVSGAVSIWHSRAVTFEGTVIEGGGSAEGCVWVIDSLGVSLRNVTIQNCSNGIRVDGPGSAVALVGAWVPGDTGVSLLQNNVTGALLRGGRLGLRGDTVVRNNRIGISGNGGSLSSCCGGAEIASPRIESNDVYGVFLRGGEARVQGPLAVEENGLWGFVLIGAQGWISDGIVRRNGISRGGQSGGGILAVGGLVEFTRGEVSGNTGAGIVLGTGSTGRLLNTRVTGNAEEGVDVQSLSVVSVSNGTVVQDNGNFDLRCSPNSHAMGFRDGIGRLQCPGFDKGPDPVPGGGQ